MPKGVFPRKRRPIMGRFWEKVTQTSNCWIWTSTVDRHGYGRFYTGGSPRIIGAHQFAYQILIGPVPQNLELDHLCRNPLCVNPWHLEAVTHKENLQRGKMPYGTPTHCQRGHPRTQANTFTKPKGKRECLTCRRNRQYVYNHPSGHIAAVD